MQVYTQIERNALLTNTQNNRSTTLFGDGITTVHIPNGTTVNALREGCKIHMSKFNGGYDIYTGSVIPPTGLPTSYTHTETYNSSVLHTSHVTACSRPSLPQAPACKRAVPDGRVRAVAAFHGALTALVGAWRGGHQSKCDVGGPSAGWRVGLPKHEIEASSEVLSRRSGELRSIEGSAHGALRLR